MRCDGETVVELVRSLSTVKVLMDFDGTLSTTKSGGKPIANKHQVDTELLSLMSSHACTILTRNSYTSEMIDFLKAKGAPEDLHVQTVPKKGSKAGYVLKTLSEDHGDVVFIDDTIAELIDPLIACNPRLHRVLFVRSIL